MSEPSPPGKGVYLIAEAGVNHNGCLDTALALVDAAQQAGADAVKFQTFKAENLVTTTAPKARYQTETTDPGESQLAMLKALELDHGAHLKLATHCWELGIAFLSTPFDVSSLGFLVDDLKLESLKLSSGAITHGPLLLAAGQSGKKIILSTGMSTLEEVEKALDLLGVGMIDQEMAGKLQKGALDDRWGEYLSAIRHSPEAAAVLQRQVTLLHCTTAYPTPPVEVNLRAMDTLRTRFGLEVGFSDHSQGIAIPMAAVARGAVMVEKHFTLDCSQPGPDHRASLEPAAFKAMAQGIREIEAALGDGEKIPTATEMQNRSVVRASLVALEDIAQGETLTRQNLGVKRPGTGLSPMEYWHHLGKAAKQDYRKNQPLA
ncbi:MAG: N-acetylneuraminate synthase [Magnetococcales bacterium]|nr:N-acetylneuraminate synthase [Magnetococcales bacterium]